MNTIIIPTYNEQENIAELAQRIRAATNHKVNVLVVDDSPDYRTAQAAHNAGCVVLQRTNKKGLSSAVIDGINFTDSNKVIVMDADLQHPPELIPQLLKQLDTSDFVVASRYVKGGGCKEWDLDRKVISRVANLAARPLTSVSDAVSGFFGFRRSGAPREVIESLNDRGFKIMLELLIRGNWDSVAEVPYTFGTRTRGQTKMRWEQIRDYLLQLASLYLYKFRWLRFGIVGASGTVVSLTTLYLVEHFILHTAFQSQWGAVAANRSYLVAFIPAFILAVTNNYCLNNLWTFRERVASKVGYPKYVAMAAITLPLDLAILFALTEFVGLWYVLSAAIAIITVFVVRYAIANKWIWRRAVS